MGYIKEVCQLKTFVGLQPLVRFDAKHRRCTIVVALDEDAIVDFKQKRRSIT